MTFRQQLHRLNRLLYPPVGRGVRDLIGIFSIAHGALRLGSFVIPPDHLTMAAVSILPADFYGALLILIGLALLFTGPRCRRVSWFGQVAATFCAGLWLLLSLDVLTTSVASSVNALIIAAAAANEVRTHDC